MRAPETYHFSKVRIYSVLRIFLMIFHQVQIAFFLPLLFDLIKYFLVFHLITDHSGIKLEVDEHCICRQSANI